MSAYPADERGEDPPGHRSWLPAPELATRGTLVVLPGRGEHGGVYERFGRRLAADAYAVHALGVAPGDGREAVTAAVRAALGQEPAGPVVLVGSDTGALQALRAAVALHAEGLPQGVVLAGLPLPASPHRPGGAPEEDAEGADTPGWEEELAARTSCPTHRAQLSSDPGIGHGALFAPVPARLAQDAEDALSSGAVAALPALVLHGGADTVSPVAAARAAAASLPRAELVTLLGGTHDVLNDAPHRSVAAAVVQWLERLRAGGDRLADILAVEAPAGGA